MTMNQTSWCFIDQQIQLTPACHVNADQLQHKLVWLIVIQINVEQMHTTVFIAMCAIPDILAKESFLF